MALTLQLADTNGAFLSESYAILDEELLVYLSGLDGFPALQELRARCARGPASRARPWASAAHPRAARAHG